MLQLCVLNSIAPKLRSNNENLVAKKRNWFSDGYRVSAPGTSTCKTDTDCEADELCQSGYCTGLRRIFGTYGLFYGDEYRQMITNPYIIIPGAEGKVNDVVKDMEFDQGDPDDYNYDYTY